MVSSEFSLAFIDIVWFPLSTLLNINYYVMCIHPLVIGKKGFKFGQKPPPLTEEIKGILDDYSDGQIFKVYCTNLVQWTAL